MARRLTPGEQEPKVVMGVRLTPEEKEDFMNGCLIRDTTSAVVIRKFVRQLLAKWKEEEIQRQLDLGSGK